MKTLSAFSKISAAMLGLLALLFISSNACAQLVSAYTVTTFSGTYQSIVGDGVSSVFLQGQDDATYTSSTGFAFTYDGTNLASGATWCMCSNGFLGIGTTVSSVPDGNRYGVAWNVNNCIMPFSADLVLYNGAGYYEVSGTSPNRVMTFEWSNFIIYYNTSYQTGMQAKLFETSNNIEFWYKNLNYSFGSTLPSTGDPAAGIVGLNGNPYSSDHNYFNASASSLPSSQLRFSPIIPPNIQLSTAPKTIDFGFAEVGLPIDKQVTVTNAGTQGLLTINSATITGVPDYTIIPPLPGPLSPGQNANITVEFTAQVNGVRQAVLNITSNGRDSAVQSIALIAQGVAPQISVDSTVLFKKTRTPLGDTLTGWIHITSVSQVPLFIFSYPITGIDADQYYISHYPANPIPPLSTDSLQVTYVATREGLRAATLTINNNSFNLPALAITLRGTGILPHIVVTPPVLLFDSTREGDTVCKNITISNPGSDTLRIYSNYLSSNDGDFHYTGLTLPSDVAIPPDQTRSVGVCFVPIQQGERQARLFLKTNIPFTFDTPRQDTAGTITVDIRGTGVPFGVFANAISGPPVIDSALIGVQVCRTDSLKNTGDADIMVTGLTIGGTVFTYSGLPPFPFMLKAKSVKTFQICGTPNQQGLLSSLATVTGTTGGSAISATLPLAIFGFKACIGTDPVSLFDSVVVPNDGTDSTLCVTVTNCGDIAAVYNVKISGTAAADYFVTPSASATVAAHGGTTVFCVKYKPTVVGISHASLDITASDGSTSSSVPLAGSDGCAIVTPTADAVPATGVLASSNFNVTINNTGSFEWTANAGNVAPPDGVFSIVGLDQPMAPAGNGAIVVHMKFTPVVLGNASAILTFPNAAPCQNAPISVTLNGVGVVNAVKDQSSGGFTLDQSYPNPTQGRASFNYTTPRETEVQITLADMTGKTVRTLITGRVSEGPHTVNFNAGDLPSGTYVYILESGSTRLVREFILTK